MADYLKLPEVARRLDVSEKTARRMVKSGSLPAVFIGGAYRISEEDLTEFLQNAKVEPGKVQASPSPEQPNLNGLIEEERRRAELEEIRESYSEEREAAESYLARWERWLETGGIPEEAVREFLMAARAMYPALRGLSISELTEISIILRTDTDDGLLEEAKAESAILPLVNRYWELGHRLTEVWNERCPEEENIVDLEAMRREPRFRRTG